MANAPITEQAAKDVTGLRLFFRGLEQHYLTAAVEGRIEVWRRLGHGLIDMMADAALKSAQEKPSAD